MKYIVLIAFALIGIHLSYGQKGISFNPKRGAVDTLVFSNRNPIDLTIFADKLGLDIMTHTDHQFCMARTEPTFYQTCLLRVPISGSSGKYQVSFTTKAYDSNKLARIYSEFLLSAFKQEYLPETVKQPLYPLEHKSFKEFRRRTLINLGWGQSYLHQDNPLVTSGGFTGLGYVIEGLLYIPLLGGPFLGETTQDKVYISLTGLAGLAILKLLLVPQFMKPFIKRYNSLVNSGYQAPIMLKDI